VTHYYAFSLFLLCSSSIAFTIYCSVADTTVHAPAAPVASPTNADDSGHDSEAKSTAMVASSSLTYGATKMARGNPRTH
jgi:hypothetical protein